MIAKDTRTIIVPIRNSCALGKSDNKSDRGLCSADFIDPQQSRFFAQGSIRKAPKDRLHNESSRSHARLHPSPAKIRKII